MPRPSRSVLLTAALTLGALIATALPASAQQTTGLFQASMQRASDGTITVSPSFLTAEFAAPLSQGTRSQNQQGFGFGIKGGFLFNSAKSAQRDFGNETGTAIGIFFGGNRTGDIGVMGELLYVKKFAPSSPTSTTLDAKVYYLEIPILLRINIGDHSVNGFNVYGIVGPVVDIRLNAKLKVNDLDIKKRYEGVDLGVIAGGGVEFLRFIAEARYNWGLRAVNSGDFGNTTEIKGRTFYILFGFRIN